MHLSVAAIGTTAPKTLCLSGEIQGTTISVLIDSGSSHTFVSTLVARSLAGVQKLLPEVPVQVTNGVVLNCTSYIPAASWSEGYTFTSDLKLLPLSSL